MLLCIKAGVFLYNSISLPTRHLQYHLYLIINFKKWIARAAWTDLLKRPYHTSNATLKTSVQIIERIGRPVSQAEEKDWQVLTLKR